MFVSTTPFLSTSFFPPGPASTGTQDREKKLFREEQPRKPDWLILLMSALFLLTLLIAWLIY